MRDPTDTEAFSDMDSWAMRRFAARAFAVLQGVDAGDGQLTDVEIIDDQGRTARATFRTDEGRVAFKVNAGPTLSVGDNDDVKGPVMDAGVPRGLLFESYWDVTERAGTRPVQIDAEQVAREAFLAGLAHRDTGQPA